MIKKMYLMGLLGLSILQSYAQSHNTPAPDAKFIPGVAGNTNTNIGSIFSPSLFDGSANVGIPIFNYSTEYGDYGVSLSYNTKGVTVDETSGPVGTHWSLNAAGTIRRVVKDYPDDIWLSNLYSGSPVVAGRFHYSVATSPIIVDYIDAQNDDYIISVGKVHTTFQIGKEGFVFTNPKRHLKVEFTKNGNIYPITDNSANVSSINYGFRITDEDGTQYYFEPNGPTTGKFISGHPPTSNLYVTYDYLYTGSWVVSKIVFINGQEINYSYKEHYIGANYLGLSKNHVLHGSGEYPQPGTFIKAYEIQETIKDVEQIDFPNNVSVHFVFDQTPAEFQQCQGSIKQIEVRSEQECIKYKLNKVYHTANEYGGVSETAFDNSCTYNGDHLVYRERRLMLKSIDILNCSETLTEPYYSFEYSGVGLPNKLGGAIDYFGYHNSITTLGLTDPPAVTNPLTSNAYGTNREITPNADNMAAGSLKKVYNAYGKSVTFNYEVHSGLVNVIDNLPTDGLFVGKDAADGLRLKSIVHKDKYRPADSMTVNYTYSGGQFFLNGGYFSYPSKTSGGNITEYNLTTNYVSPHQFINGSNHGYSNVTVEERDAANNLLGKTEYEFSNFKNGTVLNYHINGFTNGKHYYQPPYTDKQYIKDWLVGLPMKVTHYDNQDIMTSRVTNHYDSVVDYTSSVAGLGLNSNTLRETADDYTTFYNPLTLPVIARDTFAPYTGTSLLSKTIKETFIHSGLAITDEIEYGYDDKYNQVWVQTKSSTGAIYWVNSIYNYEVCRFNLAACSPALDALTDNGIEKVVAMERWEKATPVARQNTGDKLVDAHITGYEMVNGKLLAKSLYSFNTGSPVSFTQHTGLTSVPPASGYNLYSQINHVYNNGVSPVAYLRKVSEVQQFDDSGNPLEVKVMPANVYKSMLWDAPRGVKMAEVVNAQYTDVAYTSFESNVYGVTVPGTETITNGRFTYKQHGIQNTEEPVSGGAYYKLEPLGLNNEVISPVLTAGKAYVITFWSKYATPDLIGPGFNFLPVESLYTVDGWTCYKSEFTLGSNGAVTLFSPGPMLLIDEIRLFPKGATMVNATYRPLFGKSSETDATGRVTKYYYDDFGRPTMVRNQEGHIINKTEYHVGQ